MPIGDFYEVRLYAHLADQASVNTFHLKVTNSIGGGPVFVADVLTTIASTWPTAFKSLMATDARYDGMTGRRISAVPSQQFREIGNAGAGTSGADPCPRQVAGILSKYALLGGKHGRGRNYMPFPSTADLDNTTGIPVSTYVAALTFMGAAVLNPVIAVSGPTTETLQWCIYNRVAPAASPLVISYEGKFKWGTMYKRGDYGRVNAPFA